MLNKTNIVICNINPQLDGVSMTPSTISKIESKSRMVTDKELVAFSKALGTNTQELVKK